MGEAASTAKVEEAQEKEPAPVVETPAAEVALVEGESLEGDTRITEVMVTSAGPHQEDLLAIVVSSKAVAMAGAIEGRTSASHECSHALALERLRREEGERRALLDVMLGDLNLLHEVSFESPFCCLHFSFML
jgi:hypothetical protein